MHEQSKVDLSALIESTEALIWSVDLDFRLIGFNNALRRHFEETFGIRPAVGMRSSDLVPSERVDLFPPLYRRVLDEGSIRTEFSLANGRILELSLNQIVVNGATTGISIFGQDITERKLLEDQLRENESVLKDAQIIGGLGSYVLDFPSGVWTATEVLDGIFGIGKDFDHTVAGWLALIHPADRAMITAYLADEVVGQGKPFDKEYRIVRQTDRSERWVHGVGRLQFDAEGHPVTMRGVVRDITDRKLHEMQLRDSEGRYRSTFEQAPVGIVHTSFEGMILWCNARFADIVGYPSEEVPGLTFQQITDPEDLGENADALNRLVLHKTGIPGWEKRYIRKDGSTTWVKVTASVLRDSDGRPLHFVAFVEDINDRKSAEVRLAEATNAMRASEARYRTVFQTSLDGICISRASDGMYIDVSNKFLEIMGFKREEVIGRTSLELNFWADPRTRQEMVDVLSRNSSFRDAKTLYRKKNGHLFWVLISSSVIEIEGAPCILSVVRDISDAEAAEEEIKNLAFYDPLTRLPNRRLLLDRLQQALAVSSRNHRNLALLFVDLDNFKTLNDTLGHRTGDLLLKEVGRCLVSCVREADTVARLGGDEFVVVLEDLGEIPEDAASQARIVGEKILAAVDRSHLLDGHECYSPASIGIAIVGPHSEATGDILQQAEIAMFQAKAAGRNTMRFFSPALQTAVNTRAEMEEDLRQTIRTKQFMLFYQPQLEQGKLIGAEALIRWNHPKRGILLPGEFISLAEETGLILPLGNWVLETACKQIAAWANRKGVPPIAVAVNISARQFRQPEFVGQVLAAMNRTGANPFTLKLELTESTLVDNFEEVIAKMTVLKSHGLQLALDDFGMGYSSLSYLKRLPLDQLKIDRSFVRDILTDVTSGAIAQTIVSLGRAMGLSVIAEGVETEEQREFLNRLGCHAFQGFLFSRPLPVEEFERQWLGSAAPAAPIPQ
jgi:diguanylate cyclase (GGDEF)-like protein/PAS domain S-box-containing protein